MKLLVNLDLSKNELQNAVIQVLATAPSSPKMGQVYYNSADKIMYQYDGTTWKPVGGDEIAWSKITGKPTTIAGYGITDAKIVSGTITLGANTITPVVDANYVHTDNNFTAALKTKLDGIESGAEANIIETVKVNGTALTPSSKAVDVTVPVAATVAPKVDGTAAVGTSAKFAKEDHVHPTDTSRASASDLTGVSNRVTAIEGKISSQASSANKLVSASEMGDAIAAVEAKQLYATSSQGSFATKAALTGASTFYNADGTVATPTKNDVAYVLADESHGGKAAKYVIASTNPIVWGFVITFSDTTFSQAQMDAINSGITSAKRTGYDSHVASTSNPHSVTKAQVGLGNVDNKSEATIKSDFTGAVASGNTGFPTGDAVYQAIQGHSSVAIATGTISTSQTSKSVSYSGTFVGCIVKDSTTNEIVICDVVVTATAVTVTVASAPAHTLNIAVAYVA